MAPTFLNQQKSVPANEETDRNQVLEQQRKFHSITVVSVDRTGPDNLVQGPTGSDPSIPGFKRVFLRQTK